MTTGTLVDANVLLDLLTVDPVWRDWSLDALSRAADQGPLWINPIIYAEVAAHFTRVEDLDSSLPEADYLRAALPWEAAHLAGRAHRTYRRRGGTRASTLPDFFIGAHASVADLRLLTRDPRRYRTYFPAVELAAPEDDQ